MRNPHPPYPIYERERWERESLAAAVGRERTMGWWRGLLVATTTMRERCYML